jgi:hypothetical protein
VVILRYQLLRFVKVLSLRLVTYYWPNLATVRRMAACEREELILAISESKHYGAIKLMALKVSNYDLRMHLT